MITKRSLLRSSLLTTLLSALPRRLRGSLHRGSLDFDRIESTIRPRQPRWSSNFNVSRHMGSIEYRFTKLSRAWLSACLQVPF